MRRLRLGRRRRLVALAALWLGGLALTRVGRPPAPREDLQFHSHEYHCEFLGDNLLVKIPLVVHENRTDGVIETGPIRVVDIRTSEVRASYFGPNDGFDDIHVLAASKRRASSVAGNLRKNSGSRSSTMGRPGDRIFLVPRLSRRHLLDDLRGREDPC